MKTLVKLAILLIVFNVTAQKKNIIISDSLILNADEMKVKVGTVLGNKIPAFKFGEYSVTKSKKSSIVTKQKANLLGTKNQYKTAYKFYFILNNNSSDSVVVRAEFNKNIKETFALELLPPITSRDGRIEFLNFYWGDDNVLKDSVNFVATITESTNKEDVWNLLMLKTSGSEINYKNEGILTNGDRIIYIVPVSSSNENELRPFSFPALGYEFVENNNSICAVQYLGSGALGYNKNIIWIHSKIDQRIKLILAAAMTALLEIKSP
jgi:hypothetical protein